MSTRNRRGLTLVEVLVVVAVLGIIAAIAAPSFTDMLNRRRVQAVATNLLTDLAYLRSEARLRPNQVIAYFNMIPATSGMSCYTLGIPAGNTGLCSCRELPDACTLQSVEIKTERIPNSARVSFAPVGTWPAAANFGGNSRLFFASPQLTPSVPDFRVDVCGSSHASVRAVLRIEFLATGRPKICSPNGSMSGYVQCANDEPPPSCINVD